MDITREETTMMKGAAIFTIAVHNLLHWNIFGFAPENEFYYSEHKRNVFMDAISHPSYDLLFQLFSFLGWSIVR